MPPVRALAAARRARAWSKFPSLKTWIGVLCKREAPTGIQAWVSKTRTWLKRNKLLEADGGGGEESPEESTYQRVLKAEWGAAERPHKAKGTLKYLSSGYASISSMVAIPPLGRREQVKLGPGLRMVSLCRIGGLWTAASLARAHKDREGMELFEDMCPCCKAWVVGRGEDVDHILVECNRWRREREMYLGRFIRRMIADHGPLGSDQLGVFLLGGTSRRVRIWDWLPPRKGSGLPQFSREEVAHCGALEVARFLQSIERERREIVRDLASLSSLDNSGAEAR